MGRYNHHQWDIPACWFGATYLKLLYAQVMTFGMTLLFSRAAILLLYLEIFGVEIGFRVAVYIGLTFNALLCLIFCPMASYYNAPHAGKSWESLFDGHGEESLMPMGYCHRRRLGARRHVSSDLADPTAVHTVQSGIYQAAAGIGDVKLQICKSPTSDTMYAQPLELSPLGADG